MESAATVDKIVGTSLHGPTTSRLVGADDCEYYQANAQGTRVLTVGFTPFPSATTQPTLAGTRKALEGIAALGTAQERANEKFISEPRWGADAFLDAALVNGLPGGTQEQLDAYTAHWDVSVYVVTPHLLAGPELGWLNALVAALPS